MTPVTSTRYVICWSDCFIDRGWYKFFILKKVVRYREIQGLKIKKDYNILL